MLMGDELKWLLKEEGGHIVESCDILSKICNMPTLPVVGLALFMYTCSESAMFLSYICLCKWCQPSVVSPSSTASCST